MSGPLHPQHQAEGHTHTAAAPEFLFRIHGGAGSWKRARERGKDPEPENQHVCWAYRGGVTFSEKEIRELQTGGPTVCQALQLLGASRT